jgi:glycerophosphoryl diester phosphodiesterase
MKNPVSFFVCIFVIVLLKPICRLSAQYQPGNTPDFMLAAHRGGFDAACPENSLMLFRFSIAQTSCQPLMLEFDIRQSRSGTLWLMHDATVDRTTDGSGRIDSLTDAELSGFHLRDRNGMVSRERIPRFTEVLDSLGESTARFMLDAKGPVLDQVIQEVKKRGLAERCILLTFSREAYHQAIRSKSGMLVSALVKDSSDMAFLLGADPVAGGKAAYVETDTPDSVVEILSDRGITLIGDMSESLRYSGIPAPDSEYRKRVRDLRLNVLISDFPVAVSRIFCTNRE